MPKKSTITIDTFIICFICAFCCYIKHTITVRKIHGMASLIILVDLTLTQFLNLLNPTGHVMHHQFNIKQLYVPPTLFLCVLYLSENKQRLLPLTA